MPFKGTNREAYRRAKIGKTKKERSEIYYREKDKLESKSLFCSRKRKVQIKFNRKNTMTPTISKIKIRKNPLKFVPRRLILDEIRDDRNPKTISRASNKIAIFLVETFCYDMSNDQKNMLRSTIAFIASETINKSLEKPLKIIDNIEMFIKIGKIIYKVLMRYNKESREYYVDYKEIKVMNNDSKYLKYLEKYPKIKQIEKRDEVLDYLGKEVFIKVDRPLGSVHPKYNNLIYKTNYGYLLDACSSNDKKQEAYIIGVDEPIQEYRGIVKAIIIHKNDNEAKLVVCSKDKYFSKKQINKMVQFQEKNFDIVIVM